MTRETLPLPPVYDPANAARWDYRPDQAALLGAASDWRRAHGIRASGADEFDLHLLLIDVQKDFCLPDGTLYVGGRSGTGAIDDTRRMAEFVYRNLATLTNITTTMDTHIAFQIFFPSFLGRRPRRPAERAPGHHARRAGQRRGAAQPGGGAVAVQAATTRGCAARSQHYCAELESAGKYQLYLWPPHCILGSDGHALVGVHPRGADVPRLRA